MDTLQRIKDPEDYFKGIGYRALPAPFSITLFLRPNKKKLQQEALHNRSHHRFVLIFNLQTSGLVHVDHLTLPFHPGQALLIHPYQFHHYSNLASSTLQWLICTFELSDGSQLAPLRNRVIDIQKNTEEARSGLITEWIRCSEPEWSSELQESQLQAALTRLLLCLLQNRQMSSLTVASPANPANNLLRTINRLLGEWNGGPVTIADLARKCEISESRLRTLFKETAGIPLGDYIQNYRINRAMELLRTSRLTTGEIAEEAGFGSASAFCRAFKRETGQTPRSYRTDRFTLT